MPRMADWSPDRKDAFVVGVISENVGKSLERLSSLKTVYALPETLEHIRTRHGAQINTDLVVSMLWNVIGDPLYVYRSRKPNSEVFVGAYDASHYLLVPIKTLAREVWLESAFIERKQRIEKRLRERLLFARISGG